MRRLRRLLVFDPWRFTKATAMVLSDQTSMVDPRGGLIRRREREKDSETLFGIDVPSCFQIGPYSPYFVV